MQDAVLLANHIYDITPTSFDNIKTALSNYKEERFDAIKDQYPQSYISAKLMYGHVSFAHGPSVALLTTKAHIIYHAVNAFLFALFSKH